MLYEYANSVSAWRATFSAADSWNALLVKISGWCNSTSIFILKNFVPSPLNFNVWKSASTFLQRRHRYAVSYRISYRTNALTIKRYSISFWLKHNPFLRTTRFRCWKRREASFNSRRFTLFCFPFSYWVHDRYEIGIIIRTTALRGSIGLCIYGFTVTTLTNVSREKDTNVYPQQSPRDCRFIRNAPNQFVRWTAHVLKVAEIGY